MTRRGPVGQPKSPSVHVFGSDDDPWILGVERGQLRRLDPFRARALQTILEYEDHERAAVLLAAIGIDDSPASVDPAPTQVIPNAYSLAIAQRCNLGCTYCYAEQGTFGGRPTEMPREVATGAIDRLLADQQPGARVTLAFMGGEPLTNRRGLHEATRYAREQSEAVGVDVRFALTTNASLLRDEDIELFQSHPFSITVSLDGSQSVNDQIRPLKNGRSSYPAATAGIRRLLDVEQRCYRVSARATVTPRHLDVVGTVDHLLGLGFDSVQLSPLLSAPSARDQMDPTSLEVFLGQMVSCGQIFEERLAAGQPYPLENVLNTLRRIHTYRPDAYPCGAGGGYLGVSAQGGLFACHRFVDQPTGQLGDVRSGVEPTRQKAWLSARHLKAQTPCTECWARYLCNGSCHHEVITRGRPACDWIRGWLHHMLDLYTRLRQDPALFDRVLDAIRRLETR